MYCKNYIVFLMLVLAWPVQAFEWDFFRALKGINKLNKLGAEDPNSNQKQCAEQLPESWVPNEDPKIRQGACQDPWKYFCQTNGQGTRDRISGLKVWQYINPAAEEALKEAKVEPNNFNTLKQRSAFNRNDNPGWAQLLAHTHYLQNLHGSLEQQAEWASQASLFKNRFQEVVKTQAEKRKIDQGDLQKRIQLTNTVGPAQLINSMLTRLGIGKETWGPDHLGKEKFREYYKIIASDDSPRKGEDNRRFCGFNGMKINAAQTGDSLMFCPGIFVPVIEALSRGEKNSERSLVFPYGHEMGHTVGLEYFPDLYKPFLRCLSEEFKVESEKNELVADFWGAEFLAGYINQTEIENLPEILYDNLSVLCRSPQAPKRLNAIFSNLSLRKALACPLPTEQRPLCGLAGKKTF